MLTYTPVASERYSCTVTLTSMWRSACTSSSIMALILGLASLLLVACSSQEENPSPESSLSIEQILGAMNAADSYRVTIAPEDNTADSETVVVDVESPDRFHTFAQDSESTIETIWTSNLYIRQCSATVCDAWEEFPRIQSSTSSPDQVPGFPLLPLVALNHLEQTVYRVVGSEVHIEGEVDLAHALGIPELDNCDAELGGIVVPPVTPKSTCLATADPDSTYKFRIDLWADSNTGLIRLANVSSGLGDVVYEYSDYGMIQVADPE